MHRTVRAPLPSAARLGLCLLLLLASCLAAGLAEGLAAQKAKAPAPQAEQTVEISGRVAAGLDQVFIKDPAQGYFLVQGANLAPYSGRQVTATGVVTATGAEYRTVRLKSFRIQNPDDEAPGAAGTGREEPAKAPAKRKK